MEKYHKIQTVYKRDPATNFKTLLEGDFSIPEFEYLKDNEWVYTEKVDGTNIRVIFNGEAITFAGKTDEAEIPAELASRLHEKFQPLIGDFQALFNDAGVCLHGEGYGPKIQKGGGNYRKDQDFVLFDIKIGKWWLVRRDIEDIATRLKLEIVPIIGTGTLAEMVNKTRNGFNSIWGNFLAEGIVARPSIELLARNGSRIITKIKYKDFRSE